MWEQQTYNTKKQTDSRNPAMKQQVGGDKRQVTYKLREKEMGNT